MKYLFTVICALALAAAVTACGGDEGSKTAATPAPPASAAVTPAPPVTPAPSVTPGPNQKSAKDYDFRGANWGMSKAEVMKTEPKRPKAETDDSVTYEGKFKDRITFINYKFKDDKLYRGGVVYAQKMDSADLYLKNYEDIKKEIIAVYGKPVIDGEKQTNPEAVIEPGKKAEAACKGDLMYAAQWNLPRSMVVLMMRGNSNDCVTSLIYLDQNALHSIAEQDGSGGVELDK